MAAIIFVACAEDKCKIDPPDLPCEPSEASYFFHEEGTNECPDGSRRITDGFECRHIATAKLEKKWARDWRSMSAPFGCFGSNTLNSLTFNAHETGGTRGYYAPVCAWEDCEGSEAQIQYAEAERKRLEENAAALEAAAEKQRQEEEAAAEKLRQEEEAAEKQRQEWEQCSYFIHELYTNECPLEAR